MAVKDSHLYFIFFEVAGFWTLLTERDFKKLLPWLALNSLLMVYFIGYMEIVQYAHLFFHQYELVQFVERVVCTTTIFEGTTKVIYHWVRRDTIRPLLRVFRKDFLLCTKQQPDASLKTLRKAEKMANMGIVITFFLVEITAVVWSIIPPLNCLLFDCTYLKIFPTWFPFDESQQPAKTITYLLDLLTIFYCGSFIAIVNSFVLALLITLSSQIEVLKDAICNIKLNAELKCYNNLSRIIKNDKTKFQNVNEMHKALMDEYMEDSLKTCLRDHQKILKTSKLLESIYSPLNLYQMLTSSVSICLVGFLLIIPFAIPNEAGVLNTFLKVGFKNFAYFFNTVIELFVYSWCGFIIEEQTKSLHRSFYDSGWDTCSKVFRKNILLATTRANRPAAITAGKFYQVNLQTFGSIMKASYSYLMVLYGIVSKSGKYYE